MEDKIKAFNRNASIGDLYDARTMNIINGVSLFKNKKFENFIEFTDMTEQNTVYIDDENSMEKFKKLEISASMKIDLKITSFNGSAKFLYEDKKSKRSIVTLLFHSIKTKYEKIYLTNSEVKELINYDILNEFENATHVIIGVQWGANTVASFEHENTVDSNKLEIQGALNDLKKSFKGFIDLGVNPKIELNRNNKEIMNKIKFSLVSDVIAKDKKVPETYEDIKDFFANIPLYVNDSNSGKGIPLVFTLFEIGKLNNKLCRLVKQIEFHSINRLENELCDLTDAKQELNDFVNDINENKQLFDQVFVKKVNRMQREIEDNECSLKIKLKPVLDAIRSGKEESSRIDEIINEFTKSEYSSTGIKFFLEQNSAKKLKITNFKHLKLNNIEYLIANGDIFSINVDHTDKNIFIFFTSDKLQEQNPINWNELYQFYLDFVREFVNKANCKFYICDIELNNNWKVNEQCIREYKNGKILNNDAFSSYKHMFSQPVARCLYRLKSTKPPTLNTLLVINCPNQCSEKRNEWQCETCKSYYKYGFDYKFYCECGGGECKDFAFKCSDKKHPNEFIGFESEKKLKNLLDQLYIIKRYYWSGKIEYYGSVLNSKKNGKGIYCNSNGYKEYDGEWLNDKRHGKGIVFYENGTKQYEGYWMDDKKYGKGTFYCTDGRKYEGEWVNNKRHGKGICYCESGGQEYVGDWIEDKRNGKGISYYANNGPKEYEGEWKNDSKHGKGIFYFISGEKYDGEWVDDKKHGKGVFYWKNGQKYVGDWMNNKRHGRGIYYDSNGKKEYDGELVNDNRNGKGVVYYANGIRKYEGDWVNNKKHGRGIYYDSKGNKEYEGEWADDTKNGKGTFYKENGEKYDGKWINDKRHGKGIYYNPNGNKEYDGEWAEDKKHGKGVFYLENGQKYDGKWLNNKRHGKGIQYNSNGNIEFVGEWADDKKQGEGTFYYANGEKYVGHFVNNKRHGRGIYYDSKSNIEYDGDWINDKKRYDLMSIFIGLMVIFIFVGVLYYICCYILSFLSIYYNSKNNSNNKNKNDL